MWIGAVATTAIRGSSRGYPAGVGVVPSICSTVGVVNGRGAITGGSMPLHRHAEGNRRCKHKRKQINTPASHHSSPVGFAGFECQSSSDPGASFQFGRTSMRLPQHIR